MVIESGSELTWQLIIHIPRAYAAFLNNELERTSAFNGSKPFYYFSPNHNEMRPRNASYLDSTRIYQNTWEYSGKFPPYKDHYKNEVFVYDKPMLVINNKYTYEWNKPPSNYISVESLRDICAEYSSIYQIVYIRPLGHERGYWNDGQAINKFDDYDVLTEFPDVATLYDYDSLFETRTYNEVQMMIMAMSDRFISAAGGGSVLCAYFGGTHIIYHNPETKAAARDIWKTGSHLERITDSKIIGVDNYKTLWEEIRGM